MSLLGICVWREGFEAALGPERRGVKGGCRGKRGGVGGLVWRLWRFRQEKSLVDAIFYWNQKISARFSLYEIVDSQSALPRSFSVATFQITKFLAFQPSPSGISLGSQAGSSEMVQGTSLQVFTGLTESPVRLPSHGRGFFTAGSKASTNQKRAVHCPRWT